jgi:hypothetical protein
MKFLLAALIAAAVPAVALAQTSTPAKPAATAKPAPAKPAAAKPAARPAARPAATGKATPNPGMPRKDAAARAAAIKETEEGIPLEEPDPAIKLSEAEMEIAKKVHVGEFPCELGAKIKVRALRRDGFFLVTHRLSRFLMHPVESRTGAIRLEDPTQGALFLQLGNKSMLMNQKLGQRLADECQSPEQATFAADMKNKPAVNLLEGNPAQNPPAGKGGPN